MRPFVLGFSFMLNWLDWPPWPSKTRLDQYQTNLLTRYRAVDKVEGDTLATKRSKAKEELERVTSMLNASEADGKSQLDVSKQALEAAISVADIVISCSSQANDEAAERAVALVGSSLDLQVSKIGGLLTFNGLAVAVGTILWSNVALPPRWICIQPILFVILLLSSLLTLDGIRIRWKPANNYARASDELEQLLALTARRAWIINIAVILAFIGVALIAFWIIIGVPPKPASTESEGLAAAKREQLTVQSNVAPGEVVKRGGETKQKSK
jgi:hypothetical protein